MELASTFTAPDEDLTDEPGDAEAQYSADDAASDVITLTQYLALRAAQASLIVTIFLTLPFFIALLIRWGGEAVREAMGW